MGHYVDVFGLLWNPLTLIGIAFLLAGLIALGIVLKKRRKLKRLKDEGLRYDAEVVGIVAPYQNMVVGTMFSASMKVECAYTNQRGERCLVVSNQHMLNVGITKDELTAVVYVDKHEPEIYLVEVFKKDAKSRGFDKDYR